MGCIDAGRVLISEIEQGNAVSLGDVRSVLQKLTDELEERQRPLDGDH